MQMCRQLILVAILAAVNLVNSNEMNYNVEYDKSVNLTCTTEKETLISSSQSFQWILPNGDFILPSTRNHDRVLVMENGVMLHIRKVSDEDFGSYICLIYNGLQGNYAVVKKGINVNGPVWGNLMEKYRQGIIIGAIAAAVVFVLMIGICYLFERNPVLVGRDSQYMADMEKPDEQSYKHFYDNSAIELEEGQGKGETINGTGKQVDFTVIEDTNTHL